MSKITLLDKNGIVVTSNDKASIGSDRSTDYTYLKGNKAPYQIRDMHISKTSEIPAVNTAIPFLSNDEFLGVIIVDLNLGKLFKITQDRTGLGETGKVYLVNKDSYMISPSRFKEDVILNNFSKLKSTIITPKNSSFERSGIAAFTAGISEILEICISRIW